MIKIRRTALKGEYALRANFSDEEFITKFYQTRGESVSDKRVLPRFISERNQALKRLKDENK